MRLAALSQHSEASTVRLGVARMAEHGYPRRMRLASRRAADQVFRSGRYHRLGRLHAKTLTAAGPHSRFLISVKKAIGSAPERNRIKRLVREAIRLNRDRLTRPHDVCLFLTEPLTEPPPGPAAKLGQQPRLRLADVEREIVHLFHRLTQPR